MPHALATAPAFERLPPLRERSRPSPPAAQAYAHAHAKAWGRMRALETLLGEHAILAMASDELNRGAAHGYAGDLGRVSELLGQAIRALGGKP